MLNFRVSPFHRRGTTDSLDTEPFRSITFKFESAHFTNQAEQWFDKWPAFAKHLIALNFANATLKEIGFFLE